ncbi:MAG: 50S ribosomal protein L11 [Hadesarchaea archaeon DG-33-1]|nr:MAG: 50S ribosomal protein L11 [Hadesarchaea archaeon DG-33-1]
MMKATIKSLVEGGKATPGPPIGPALGPLGVNIGQIVAKINEKTAAFEGMKVPVKIIIDKKTKQFEIEVGSPPVSALIRKELGLDKGAKTAGTEVVGNLTFAQVLELAKLKSSAMMAKGLKTAVKEILGTCLSMGVTIDGKDAREVQREMDEGKHDEELR